MMAIYDPSILSKSFLTSHGWRAQPNWQKIVASTSGPHFEVVCMPSNFKLKSTLPETKSKSIWKSMVDDLFSKAMLVSFGRINFDSNKIEKQFALLATRRKKHDQMPRLCCVWGKVLFFSQATVYTPRKLSYISLAIICHPFQYEQLYSTKRQTKECELIAVKDRKIQRTKEERTMCASIFGTTYWVCMFCCAEIFHLFANHCRLEIVVKKWF